MENKTSYIQTKKLIKLGYKYKPCYTIEDLINYIPKNFKITICNRCIEYIKTDAIEIPKWIVKIKYPMGNTYLEKTFSECNYLIENLVDCLVWLKENQIN